MNKFIALFEIPPAALPVIEQILRPEEILLIEALGSESFNALEAKAALEKLGGNDWTTEKTELLLEQAYKRGVTLAEDETLTRYRIGNFYGRLDVFAITEHETYLALPRETQMALDSWYFDAYLAKLGDDEQPSADQIVTLQQTLDYIDTVDRQIWLNRCDCRTLAGYCDMPTNTCLTFKNGINTVAHRGWSKPVTKEEAKEIVKGANAQGLMQTINPNGICNCCGDCCYLFRAQKARGSEKSWPLAEAIASFDEDLCISCGLCVERCHFQAFSSDGGQISYHPERCRGCGLCAETCPVQAITMRKGGLEG